MCAYVPEVPGAVSQGRSLEEARDMVLDAVRELNLARVEQALKEETPMRRETLSVLIRQKARRGVTPHIGR
ncbi:hypothetical protein BH11ARM2_BH11ARM2_35780 [soil metagenome]